jgi:hypothetical protein
MTCLQQHAHTVGTQCILPPRHQLLTNPTECGFILSLYLVSYYFAKTRPQRDVYGRLYCQLETENKLRYESDTM